MKNYDCECQFEFGIFHLKKNVIDAVVLYSIKNMKVFVYFFSAKNNILRQELHEVFVTILKTIYKKKPFTIIFKTKYINKKSLLFLKDENKHSKFNCFFQMH